MVFYYISKPTTSKAFRMKEIIVVEENRRKEERSNHQKFD